MYEIEWIFRSIYSFESIYSRDLKLAHPAKPCILNSLDYGMHESVTLSPHTNEALCIFLLDFQLLGTISAFTAAEELPP